MSLTKLNNNLNYNQSQPDQPTKSADEMKRILDQAGIDIKEYINTILTEELDKLIESKVDKIQGKGLSEKDFTEDYETKLKGIANNANNYSLPTATGSVLGGVKTGSNITNSSGTISLTKSNVTNALGYTPPTTNTTYGVATTSANGLMSSSDKSKLDGIAIGANKTTVDSSLSSSSTNPVQNKVVYAAINSAQATANSASSTARSASDKAMSASDQLNAFFSSGGTIYGDLHLVGNFKNDRTLNDTVSNAPNVFISSNGNFRKSTSSSKRYKEDITENIEDRLNPKKLYNLPIKQFKYKENYLDKENRRYDENILGFIVEDLQEIYESAVDYNDDGTPEMWNYKVIIPAMLKLIQEQNERIKALESKEG